MATECSSHEADVTGPADGVFKKTVYEVQTLNLITLDTSCGSEEAVIVFNI